MSQLVCGLQVQGVTNFEPDPSPGVEDFMILWLAANY